jgi:hypothetical protein
LLKTYDYAYASYDVIWDMLRNEGIHYTDLSFEVMRDKLLDGYIHYDNASSEVKRGNLLDEDNSLHRVKT